MLVREDAGCVVAADIGQGTHGWVWAERELLADHPIPRIKSPVGDLIPQ